MIFFFFSSRRRHTRWTGDWSSDVCSSDLISILSGNPHVDKLPNEVVKILKDVVNESNDPNGRNGAKQAPNIEIVEQQQQWVNFTDNYELLLCPSQPFLN